MNADHKICTRSQYSIQYSIVMKLLLLSLVQNIVFCFSTMKQNIVTKITIPFL